MLKRLLLAGLALILLCVIILWGWYRIDGQPLPETAGYLEGSGYRATVRDDGSLYFAPAVPTGRGIVIMHGALIKPMSYARSAAYFAARGYTVIVPNGPARMSIAAVTSAAAWLRELPVDDWFFIGHSMGGMASLETIRSQQVDARAVALWATAMPADFSDLQLPILFIWGDNDGLLPPERFAQGRANLPDAVEYITLEGANHKNFALYSHQFFDNDASLDRAAQIEFANATTAEFFARY